MARPLRIHSFILIKINQFILTQYSDSFVISSWNKQYLQLSAMLIL